MKAEGLRQTTEHDPYQGDINPSRRAGVAAFVVPHQPPMLREPRQRAFHHPALGQHLEARQIVGAHDDLHRQLGPVLTHPVGEVRAAVTPVHPQLAQPREIREQRLQQRLRPGALGRVGRGHRRAQHQPQSIYQQEALATLGLFARIVTHRAAVRVGAHGLAVEHGGRGPGALAHRRPHEGPQAVVERPQDTFAAPRTKMVIDRLPRGKVRRQPPPLAAGLDDVEDALNQLPQGRAGATPALGAGQQRLQIAPLSFGEVGKRADTTGGHRPTPLPRKSAIARCGLGQGLSAGSRTFPAPPSAAPHKLTQLLFQTAS